MCLELSSAFFQFSDMPARCEGSAAARQRSKAEGTPGTAPQGDTGKPGLSLGQRSCQPHCGPIFATCLMPAALFCCPFRDFTGKRDHLGAKDSSPSFRAQRSYCEPSSLPPSSSPPSRACP